MNVLDRFSAAGVWLRLEGNKVVAKLTAPITKELRDALSAAKDDIRAELEAIESRRQRLLALLAERPRQQYALIYDTDASAEYDVLVMAITSHTFEVRVPKPADSLEFACRLMQMMDRYGNAAGDSRPMDHRSVGEGRLMARKQAPQPYLGVARAQTGAAPASAPTADLTDDLPWRDR